MKCKKCGFEVTKIFDGLCICCKREEEEEEYEKYLEKMVDSEICPKCGIVHGPNPYTGCP